MARYMVFFVDQKREQGLRYDAGFAVPVLMS